MEDNLISFKNAAAHAKSRNAILDVMLREPDLSIFGYRTRDHKDFEKGRRDLLSNWGVVQFELARDWLLRQGSISGSSYGLKHRAEDGDYIANGAMLVAALSLGLSVERYPGDSPNARITKSKKTVLRNIQSEDSKIAWKRLIGVQTDDLNRPVFKSVAEAKRAQALASGGSYREINWPPPKPRRASASRKVARIVTPDGQDAVDLIFGALKAIERRISAVEITPSSKRSNHSSKRASIGPKSMRLLMGQRTPEQPPLPPLQFGQSGWRAEQPKPTKDMVTCSSRDAPRPPAQTPPGRFHDGMIQYRTINPKRDRVMSIREAQLTLKGNEHVLRTHMLESIRTAIDRWK